MNAKRKEWDEKVAGKENVVTNSKEEKTPWPKSDKEGKGRRRRK